MILVRTVSCVSCQLCLVYTFFISPLSTISWEKPSNSTSQTAKQQGGTQFLIADVKKSDEGQFTCSATELSDTYSATLRIRGGTIQ